MINYFRFSEQIQFSISEISDFNDLCFPHRKPHHFYDTYRLVQNPFAPIEKNFLYGVEKDGKYIAQMLTMPTPLSINEKIIPAFWGQDYFVLDEFRGKGIGKELSKYYLKNDYYIAIGFSPKSQIIHQKMGARKIGHLSFYRKWASPIHQFKSLFNKSLRIKPKSVISYTFPDEVNGFMRVKSPARLILPQLNWNENTIESIRNKEYFEWRFFYKPFRYFVYQSKQINDVNPAYFVAKPRFYKGMNWLMIVDYRFDLKQPNQFESILKSAELLREKYNFSGILVSSSQKTNNKILHKNNFERYKHEVVLTTYPFEHDENLEEHDHFHISLADSDLDMHDYLGRFYYSEDLTEKNYF